MTGKEHVLVSQAKRPPTYPARAPGSRGASVETHPGSRGQRAARSRFASLALLSGHRPFLVGARGVGSQSTTGPVLPRRVLLAFSGPTPGFVA